MRIGILGTGNVGRTIGSGLLRSDHAVRLGSRTADNPNAEAWVRAEGDGASHGTFAEAAAFADIVFNCVSGLHTPAALEAAGADNLAGKILVDLANPLDFSQGFPPRLSVCNDDSLGEQIQRAYPRTKVVKALNTLTASVMLDPGALPEPTEILLCGDDEQAKEAVTNLLRSFGWAAPIDLGPISAARGMEAWLLLWTRLYGALGTGEFNLRIVRKEA